MQEINPKALETLKKEVEPENLNVDMFVKFGILEKEVTPIDGWTVTMHPLIQEELENVELATPTTPGMTLIQKSTLMKRPTLMWAITKINNEFFKTDEQKKDLNEKLRTAPSTTIDLLWLEYQKLYVEQFDMITKGIKKK